MSFALNECHGQIERNPEHSLSMSALSSAFGENILIAQYLLNIALKKGLLVDYGELIGTTIHSLMETKEKFKILQYLSSKVVFNFIPSIEDTIIENTRYSLMFDNPISEIIDILCWLNKRGIFLSEYELQQSAIQHNRYDFIDALRYSDVEFLNEM